MNMNIFDLPELPLSEELMFVGIDKVVEKTGFSENTVREAFKHLPIHHKRLDNGGIGYRIEGSNMHIPALLRLFMVD